MSLPTTWLALPNVGATGNQGPHPAPCADPQVRGLLRRGQFEQRPIRTHDVPYLQRGDFPEFPRATAATANPGAAHAPRARQCPLPSRETPRAVPALPCPTPAAVVPAALQSTTRPYRASLEADPTPRDTQPLLRHAPRSAEGGQRVLRPVAPTKYGITTTMLHYLSAFSRSASGPHARKITSCASACPRRERPPGNSRFSSACCRGPDR